MNYILAIDQGTTSSRAIVFDAKMQLVASAQKETRQIFPNSGWVEHDPEDIWETTLTTCKDAILKAGIDSSKIASIGITNQRETTILWDKDTGKPITNAIVWQDRRTSGICEELRSDGYGPMITEKTGLLLDPYFSASKIKWVLDNVEGVRSKAKDGKILFGTVDSFLLWRLTGGKVHATDATNAARTMLYDIRNGEWDSELCQLFGVPITILPEVRDCASDFGSTDPNLLGAAIPIRGIAGDQQAATIGQACFEPGMIKSTYGTGCFALLNTGEKLVQSRNRLLGTIAYQLDEKPTYALEGSIFSAGTIVQWMRDGLGIVKTASETESMARSAQIDDDVYIVPAFTGLGAPYWDADCRGAIYGLTRDTSAKEIVRAGLEAIGYQTKDLVSLMHTEWESNKKQTLRVDGGMSENGWAMQFMANMINAKIERPPLLETTALGVAWLAGMHVGLYKDMNGFAEEWKCEETYKPDMPMQMREKKYAGWKEAVSRTLSKN